MAAVQHLPSKTNDGLNFIREVEEEAHKIGKEVELRRVQRDQRLAAAINIVALSRSHSNRSKDVASTTDAAIISVMVKLANSVAGDIEDNPLDPIFSNVSDETLPSLIELVLSRCYPKNQNQSPKIGDVSPPSNDQLDSMKSSGK